MKTALLSGFAFVLSIHFSFSQTNFMKGSKLLGGNIGFSSQKQDNGFPNLKTSYTSFDISPVYGVAVKDNLFVGVSLGYGFGINRNWNGNLSMVDSTKRNSFSYGVFVRKYRPLKNNFSLFLQGGITGSNSKEVYENQQPISDYYRKSFGLNASITPGISYQITPKLQIESGFSNILGVGYNETSYQNFKETAFAAYTSLSNFSSSLYFGFRLLLQPKSKGV